MSEEEPTLRNIGKELFSPGYWNRARERRRSSKTVWDLIFMPVWLAAWAGYWYAFAKFFVWFHLAIHPADASRIGALTSGPMTASQALMFLVPGFAAIPLAMMTSNILMWLVPWARRASEKKAKGVKWASFREAQLALFRAALVLVPVGLISGIIGALIMGR